MTPKLIVKRWVSVVVGECQCPAREIVILIDEPVACPSCGLLHQFASFDLQGQPVVPAELGLRIATFQPKTVELVSSLPAGLQGPAPSA